MLLGAGAQRTKLIIFNIICKTPPSVMLLELQRVRVSEVEELVRISYLSVADGHICHQLCQWV